MGTVRNIAIIAHVDHGKSTMVDAFLKQSGTNLGKFATEDLIMDTNELERERGITIFAKNASVIFDGTKINIIDTPGHADFGGEVERVLNMADGSLLLVDAQEGPMPQTRFVLKKALDAGHKIIVVINKIDKPSARIAYVLDRVIELFMEFNANDEQLNFPIIYASGKLGLAGVTPELDTMKNVTPLFEAIVKHIPVPHVNPDGELQLMVVATVYDNYLGRLGLGRIERGSIENGATIAHLPFDGSPMKRQKLSALMTFQGLARTQVERVESGDIAVLAGIDNVHIGDTIASTAAPEALPPINIEKPTVRMTFGVNTSPFAGKEGKLGTSRNIDERLKKELENDVALEVERGGSAEEFVVSGRGELHLAILIEKMRREGFELQVSRPEVIMKDIDGVLSEPMEDVWVDVADAYSGMVIKEMTQRKGELKNMHVENETAHFHFFAPTRGLIGFRHKFIIETKGTGIMNSLVAGYHPKIQGLEAAPHGSLIAHETGICTPYALLHAQDRGEYFVGAGETVYEGQVVGENAKAEDIVINVCKAKQLSNFRANKDLTTSDLAPKREQNIELALEYIGDDELVEVTPTSIRLRKRILRNALRK
ncbi:MAG: translational GTPase TypA [Patescibacteria group bacterium]